MGETLKSLSVKISKMLSCIKEKKKRKGNQNLTGNAGIPPSLECYITVLTLNTEALFSVLLTPCTHVQRKGACKL